MEPLHIVNKDDLIKQIETYNDKLLIFMFTATWCGPCKSIKKQIYNNETNKGISVLAPNIVFMYIDVDECEEMAQEFGITAMPTFIFNRVINNKLTKLDEFKGADAKKLNDLINKYA